MKKIKVSEATERQIDWLTAWCTGVSWDVAFKGHYTYKPSTDWSQGGPIVERERISIDYMAGAGDAGLDVWVATRIEGPAFSEEQGPTPLIAAMRCYVISHLGEEVEIPEELE
jgi:hypothetical protein